MTAAELSRRAFLSSAGVAVAATMFRMAHHRPDHKGGPTTTVPETTTTVPATTTVPETTTAPPDTTTTVPAGTGPAFTSGPSCAGVAAPDEILTVSYSAVGDPEPAADIAWRLRLS